MGASFLQFSFFFVFSLIIIQVFLLVMWLLNQKLALMLSFQVDFPFYLKVVTLRNPYVYFLFDVMKADLSYWYKC